MWWLGFSTASFLWKKVWVYFLSPSRPLCGGSSCSSADFQHLRVAWSSAGMIPCLLWTFSWFTATELVLWACPNCKTPRYHGRNSVIQPLVILHPYPWAGCWILPLYLFSSLAGLSVPTPHIPTCASPSLLWHHCSFALPPTHDCIWPEYRCSGSNYSFEQGEYDAWQLISCLPLWWEWLLVSLLTSPIVQGMNGYRSEKICFGNGICIFQGSVILHSAQKYKSE